MPSGIFPRISAEERFWRRVDKSGKCWIWKGSGDGKGYGVFWVGGGREAVKAHQYAYEILVGKTRPGTEIDHLCRVRSCVNPKHLEAVSHRENVLRGTAPTAINGRKKSCIRGHRFTKSNTFIRSEGRRGCRRCRHEYWRTYKRRDRQ